MFVPTPLSNQERTLKPVNSSDLLWCNWDHCIGESKIINASDIHWATQFQFESIQNITEECHRWNEQQDQA